MFNATAQNTFALDKFGYQAGYANSVAGATQTNINTNFGLQQQQMYLDLMRQYQKQAQDSAQTNALFSLGATILGGMDIGKITSGGKGGGGKGGSPQESGYGGGVGNAVSSIASGIGDAIGSIF